MRTILFLGVFVFSLLAGFCQQGAIQWSVSAKQFEKLQYEISVSGSMEANWYIYAENSTEHGLKAIRLETDNDSIQLSAKLQPVVSPVIIQETIFNARLKVYQGRVQLLQRISVKGTAPSTITVTIHAFAANGETFLPVEATQEVALEDGVPSTENTMRLSSVDLTSPVAACGDKMVTVNSNYGVVFLKGFGGGLIALLVPCIFPMLPVTVSFFMNKAGSKKQGVRNGFLYGRFIFLIYLLASISFHIAGKMNFGYNLKAA